MKTIIGIHWFILFASPVVLFSVELKPEELAYFEKMTDEEIAGQLDLKITTVRYCLKKARKAIREMLEKNSAISKWELESFFSRVKQ